MTIYRENPVYLTNGEHVEFVRQLIETPASALVSLCAYGKRHALLIVPDEVVTHIGFKGKEYTEVKNKTYTGGSLGDYLYVGVMAGAKLGEGLYPMIKGGYLRPNYITEKLGVTNMYSAIDITVFINAIIHKDGARAYLETIPFTGDHVDYDKF